MTRGPLAAALSAAIIGACSSSSSGVSPCGSGTVHGTGPLSNFSVVSVVGDTLTGVTVCFSTSRIHACGAAGAPAGTLVLCFGIAPPVGQSSPTVPGTYAIGTVSSGAPGFVALQQCEGSAPAKMLDETVLDTNPTGSITITAITGNAITGSAMVTFDSGDMASVTFDAVRQDGYAASCPGP